MKNLASSKLQLLFIITLTIFFTLIAYFSFHSQENVTEIKRNDTLLFKESQLAHHLLDHLKGVEIGASAHNPFGLRTLNIDYTSSNMTVFKQMEQTMVGSQAKIDIIASADHLPLANNSQDFVISSHVIEHMFDPIQTILEWFRVVVPSGYIYIIAPHKERTFDVARNRTTLQELLDRHSGKVPKQDGHGHFNVWITQDFLELCQHFNWTVVTYQDVDDKVTNGFAVVLQK
uniref:Methyltransferase type 11 domain-containing protein n=1 Tax=Ditylenchus dipsaci TaxID=166011 RepID=A0A915ER18_9BILA